VEVVIVEINKVEAVNEDPVSVEKAFRARPGTLIDEAFRVETVSVELKNPVFAVIVLIATVDAIREDPVRVEN
jgi:hypothetical protein